MNKALILSVPFYRIRQ